MTLKVKKGPGAIPGGRSGAIGAKAQVPPRIDARKLEARLWGKSIEYQSPLAGNLGYTTGTSVSGLVDRYKLGELSRPLARFAGPLAFVDESIHSNPRAQAVADALLTHDSRREIFTLEALLRLYEPELGRDGERPLKLVKELEDHVGATTSFQNAKVAMRQNHAPPAIINRIAELEDAGRQAVIELISEKWLPGVDGKSKAVSNIIKGLVDHDFGKPGHDRKRVAKSLAKLADKLRHKDFPTDSIVTVHKFRRQLRWLALYLEAVDGLVQPVTRKNPSAHYSALMTDTKLVKAVIGAGGLPPPHPGEEPIEIPGDLYFGLQKAIYDLGVVKDDVELRELLSSVLEEQGKSPDEVAKILGSKGSQKDMQARATAIRDELATHHVLKGLQEAFEKVD